MARDENTPAMRALKRKVGRLMDPLDVELIRIGTQTSKTNREILYHWAKEMRYHESKTAQPYERVYLVVSDLKLMLASRQKVEKTLEEKIRSVRHSDVFLHSDEIDDLREKHWALEVDGRYYELDRDKKDRSFFSSRRRVGHFDRRVAARIFLGTTHFERRALESVGRAVIATQVTYELTRNNCHRFVRVFTSLVLCRNHPEHTISELPFGVEEYMASRRRKEMMDSGLPYRNKVCRHVGAGVAWTLFIDGLQAELRRTFRTLDQKTTSKNVGTIYYNEFTSKQEQTSYISELDPRSLPFLQKCRPLADNPYIRLLRFEKVAHIQIIPSSTSKHYRINSVLHGMISGPYGGNRSDAGSFERVQPLEIMRDRSHILRDGNGRRLEWPEQDWRKVLAVVQDLLLHPPTRKRYDHSTKKTELLKSVGPFKDHPYLVDIASWAPWAAGATWLYQWNSQKRKEEEEAREKEGKIVTDMLEAEVENTASTDEGEHGTNSGAGEIEIYEDSGAGELEGEGEGDEERYNEDLEPELKRLEQQDTDEIDNLYRAFNRMPLRAILHRLDSE